MTTSPKLSRQDQLARDLLVATIKSSRPLMLLRCKDVRTGEFVTALCTIYTKGDKHETIPLARLFAGDPCKELIPPTDLQAITEA